jgi:hypothetical protein
VESRLCIELGLTGKGIVFARWGAHANTACSRPRLSALAHRRSYALVVGLVVEAHSTSGAADWRPLVGLRLAKLASGQVMTGGAVARLGGKCRVGWYSEPVKALRHLGKSCGCCSPVILLPVLVILVVAVSLVLW